MRVSFYLLCTLIAGVAVFVATPAAADPFSFSTGTANNLMAAAARPDSAGEFEIEPLTILSWPPKQ